MKILVVDDSKAVHAYVKNCFRPFDVNLTHVLNGKEALEALGDKQNDFDLVLLDWEMPFVDGPTTFDSMPKKGVIPVIMMTTKNSPSDISFMLQKGINEYILKPFTPDILVEKIELVIGEGLPHGQ